MVHSGGENRLKIPGRLARIAAIAALLLALASASERAVSPAIALAPLHRCPGPNIYLTNYLGVGDVSARYMSCSFAHSTIRQFGYFAGNGYLRIVGWRCHSIGTSGEDLVYWCSRGVQVIKATAGP